MIELILRDAQENLPDSQLNLVDNNWKTSMIDLLREVAEAVGGSASGDITHACTLQRRSMGGRRPPKGWIFYEEAEDEAVREQEVLQLLRSICANERNGPSQRQLQLPIGERIPAWKELARLLKPGTLLAFLRAHADEFEFVLEGDSDCDGGRHPDGGLGSQWRQTLCDVRVCSMWGQGRKHLMCRARVFLPGPFFVG